MIYNWDCLRTFFRTHQYQKCCDKIPIVPRQHNHLGQDGTLFCRLNLKFFRLTHYYGNMKSRVLRPLYITRGPWTAMPALNSKKQSTFYVEEIFKIDVILWAKQNVCAQFLIFSPKGSFSSSSLNPYYNAYWPEVHPILWSRCPAFRWGTFCQIWMVGLGVTFGQPKGFKLGILC